MLKTSYPSAEATLSAKFSVRCRCPSCGGNDTYRSKTRGMLEQAMKLLTPYRYYRCMACDNRFLF